MSAEHVERAGDPGASPRPAPDRSPRPAADGSARPDLDVAGVVEALPGVARLAAGSALNLSGWSITRTRRMTQRFLLATRDADEAAALAHELGVAAATVSDMAQQVATGVPLPEAVARSTSHAAHAAQHHHRGSGAEPSPQDAARRLRSRGRKLLARGRRLDEERAPHPAYEHVLDQLDPDEARILVLLARHGPQASIDVRTGGPAGALQSHLVAVGLTMIGARAACRHREDVPAYLNNLHRLGLIWFSHETLPDPAPYQVLEVQPDALAAIHAVRFPKIVRRSIELTPFGRDFYRAALDDPDAFG